MLRRGAFGIFLYNDFQLNVQELRLQARFFKGLEAHVQIGVNSVAKFLLAREYKGLGYRKLQRLCIIHVVIYDT